MNLSNISQAIAAGATLQMGIPGKVFRLMDCTGQVTVYFYKNGSIYGTASNILAGLKVNGDFDRVDIYSATAQTVSFVIADGDVSYDRFSGNVAVTNAPAVNGAFTQSRAAAVGSVAAVQLKAANAARRTVFIQNNDTAAYLRATVDGSAPTATAGIRIPPGGYWESSAGYAPTGAIQAIAESGTVASVEVVEG